jgi:hypothetical protein
MCVLDQYCGHKTIAEVGTKKFAQRQLWTFKMGLPQFCGAFSYFLDIFMKKSNSKVYS